MPSGGDATIRLIEELEATLVGSAPRVVVDDREELSISANRAGFVKLAIEFLRSASSAEGVRLVAGRTWISETDGTARVWRLEKTSDPASALARRYGSPRRFGPLLLGLSMGVIVLLAVIGVVTLASWLIPGIG